LIAVKHIIKYLKGTICIGLWYPKTTQFNMTSYSNADYTDYEWIERALVKFINF